MPLPMAIVKDQGSDLHCGAQQFCARHSSVITIYDIAHKIACMYKGLLAEDDVWCEFARECADYKNKVQLTEQAYLAPPNQRSKARYLNIDVLVDWGITHLEKNSAPLWLWRYEKNLKEWQELVEVGRIVRDFVRIEGLFKGCEEVLTERLITVANCQRAEQLACDLLDFVETEGAKIPQGKKVIGSSEIIESLFGVHKNISDRGPKPMGRLILSMASRVGEEPSEVLVAEAFSKKTEKMVDEWLKKSFTTNSQTLYKNLEENDMEEKWNHELVVA